ncbi:MAG: agmatinase [Clostridiales bacterium]|nr:agmatinase [Clostridiales bacterium]
MKNNIVTFMACDCDYEDSEIVIFGAPFDGTVSFRPGTRFAPPVMRQESYGIETYSPYLDRDMEDYSYSDIGDLDLPFGNKERVLEMIYSQTKEILEDNKKPFMFGGEHLVTYSPVKAVFEKYPDLRVIHLDAHADLRADYMDEKFSHATVLRRIWDFLGDHRIFQFGIRSGTKEEFEFAKNHTHMNRYSLRQIDQYIEELLKYPIYLTIDLDVFDPSVFPGTGTPEPGGVNFKEFIEFSQKLKGLNIVGADVVELSPHYDHSGISSAVAVKVVREILLVMSNGYK